MPGSEPTWLFVTYGGGHAAMVLPVAQRVRELGLARPVVLALTTAGNASRATGLETRGYADFVLPEDAAALEQGHRLASALAVPAAGARESAAYLGLNYADLVTEQGPEGAARAYAEFGRQCFRPLPTLRRILKAVKPQLVVATNSPRSERAAIDAARELGIRSVCLVDLFAVDERQWIARPGFADRVCVLNAAVRDMFLAHGRQPHEVVVTGNPAFDALLAEQHRAASGEMRARLAPAGQPLLLYAPSPEPERHPLRPAQSGDPLFPQRILDALLPWAQARGIRLAVRPHPSQGPLDLRNASCTVLTGREWPLEPLLHAADAACVTVSTVGLQAHLLGKPVVQVLGSIFDDGAPYGPMGIAQATPLQGLPGALSAVLETQGSRTAQTPALAPAVPRVIEVLQEASHL